MNTDPLTTFAQQLIADGRRDREVLRRRWNVPTYRAEVEWIAHTLEQNPLLIPAVETAIDAEVRRLGEALDTTTSDPETKEAKSDDRQE